MPAAHPIVVIGSINTDLVVRTPRVPAPGETVLGSDLSTLPGGKGANQAVAAARLGAHVAMIGRVGDDPSGRARLEGLRREGVGTKHVRVTPGVASGTAIILVDPRAENSIVVSPGANARVTPADVDAADSLIRSAAVVLLQLEIPLPTVRHAVALCRRMGVPTVLDPAPVPPKGLPRALMGADYLTPNGPESLRLAGLNPRNTSATPEHIARRLHARGARTLLLKLGRRGAAIAAPGDPVRRVRAHAVRAVDTTAAGDAFNGALAVALAEGASLEEAVRFANAAGALCCTVAGAQPSLPTRRAVARLLDD